MKLTVAIGNVNQGILDEDDSKVAANFAVFSRNTEKMLQGFSESDYEVQRMCKERLPAPWGEMMFHHVLACRGVQRRDYSAAHKEQLNAVNIFHREFQTMTNWPLEVLYILNGDLRRLAVQADKQMEKRGEKPVKLEECARTINKAFTICITDRAQLRISKKWGTYNIIGILFRTYFKLKSHNLCKNILRAVKASDLPDLERFPMAHQVTIRYYTGVLSFFNEDFKKAEQDLQFAFDSTLPAFHHNRRLILHYLIPTKLLHGSLPSARMLKEFPELSGLYFPIAKAIRTGNVRLFDEALTQGGSRLIGLGTYLTVERSRGVAVRTLFKKVYNCLGKINKINVDSFKTALEFVGVSAETEEVECMLANMIAQGFMRGYLSHEKKVLVLSQKDPFPSVQQQS
ncbi:COP9 signalosome complex subunit 12 [Entomortierella parvispora]|uniref:COP9 signalosome complex subunit 12 n=1 Tax=Entomortierella parvispora TaxID=205924 RepID=A0A9P3HH48_9FUNG|nr:COP9 signalosome complex subunit 12 [Entomortierella parvispora]